MSEALTVNTAGIGATPGAGNINLGDKIRYTDYAPSKPAPAPKAAESAKAASALPSVPMPERPNVSGNDPLQQEYRWLQARRNEYEKLAGSKPELPQNNPFKALTSLGTLIGVFGSLFTRQPLISGLNALTASHKAMQENDLNTYLLKQKEWDMYNKYIMDVESRQIETFKGIQSQYNTDVQSAQKSAELYITANHYKALEGLSAERNAIERQSMLFNAVQMQANKLDRLYDAHQQLTEKQYTDSMNTILQRVAPEYRDKAIEILNQSYNNAKTASASAYTEGRIGGYLTANNVVASLQAAGIPLQGNLDTLSATAGIGGNLTDKAALGAGVLDTNVQPNAARAEAQTEIRTLLASKDGQKQAGQLFEGANAIARGMQLMERLNDPDIKTGEIDTALQKMAAWWNRNIGEKFKGKETIEDAEAGAFLNDALAATGLSVADKNAVMLKDMMFEVLAAERAGYGSGRFPVTLFNTYTPLLNPTRTSKQAWADIMRRRYGNIFQGITATNKLKDQVIVGAASEIGLKDFSFLSRLKRAGEPETTAAPKTSPNTAISMPQNPTAQNLVKDQVYNTAKGPARWNGSNFEVVE
jgi:hypothetical protein